MARGLTKNRPSDMEYVDSPVTIKFPASLLKQLNENKKTTGVPISTQIRQAIEEKVSGKLVHVANVGLDSAHLKFLTKAPAGPWDEALEHAGHYVINKEIAEELGVNPATDVVVRVLGQSMEGAGIFEGALLVMEMLGEKRVARRGDIALVQIVKNDGCYESTITRWNGGEPPKLTDGEGNAFALPKNVRECRAVAVARGVISRL